MLASSYPFLDVFWTLLVFFVWVLWFMLLFYIIVDVFRRHDISGWGKAAWLIFVIILPFLGVFIYLITQGAGMGERNVRDAQQQQQQFDQYVKGVAGSGGAAAEIEKAQSLLASGAITQQEFDQLKARALAS